MKRLRKMPDWWGVAELLRLRLRALEHGFIVDLIVRPDGLYEVQLLAHQRQFVSVDETAVGAIRHLLTFSGWRE